MKERKEERKMRPPIMPPGTLPGCRAHLPCRCFGFDIVEAR